MAELKKLSEALTDPDSHPTVAVMFIDMVGSTDLKGKTTEANWLNTYSWFYDTVTEPIMQFGGKIVKFLGDGVMAVFTDDKAVEAINGAIKIQESIAQGVESRKVEVSCSIGIATDVAVLFGTPGENLSADYIGTVVDKAARLSSVASPMAIFADDTTIAAANATRILSQVGNTPPRRRAPEYLGPQLIIALKGFSTPVVYHEILWARQRYGVRSEIVPQAAIERPQGPPPEDTRDDKETRRSGQVRIWFEENTRGFIQGDAEDFYFDNRYLVPIRITWYTECHECTTFNKTHAHPNPEQPYDDRLPHFR